ncbi:hypothetical protein [Deinococcus hopiensis]|uniref:Uncharacterized protein n=1 Tax=Deinococcus hopiensis KR-140 TaxID=695939 RepID=A0A1W1VF15_9DEIO|nr:hypothetical protein [Deinococcus hopiensis]SMB91813.1 hypothetical protein SAMN00790413_01306 [Deinococcus hopiensis KR-140]
MHLPIPWKQLWVNGRQMDPATARLDGDTITLPCGTHEIDKRTQLGELYVTPRTL